MRLRLLIYAISVFSGMNAALAASPSPVGQWTVTFYTEPSLTTAGATQGVCFRADGTWFSTTFAGWKGRWFAAGERFRWTGSTSSSLATGAFGQFYRAGAAGAAAGESTSILTPSGDTSSNSTYNMIFTSSTCNAAARALEGRRGDPTR